MMILHVLPVVDFSGYIPFQAKRNGPSVTIDNRFLFISYLRVTKQFSSIAVSHGVEEEVQGGGGRMKTSTTRSGT